MNSAAKTEVIRILENYPDTKRKISLLRYELEHPQQITSDELISALNFAHGDGQPSAPGHISNKTMYIAMSYQEQVSKANSEIMDAIATKLFALERETNRLEYYLSLLDEPYRNIITMLYIDQISWDSISASIHASRRKANYLKAAAIDALVEMYTYANTP